MNKVREDLSSFSITAVPPDIPTTAAAIPTYNEAEQGTSIDDEIAQMLSYIETDEDVELANAKATEITLRLKRALDQFDKDIQKYKTENDSEIAHLSAEINAYSQEINSQVSDQTQKVNTEVARYKWLQERNMSLKQEYSSAFGQAQVPGGGER